MTDERPPSLTDLDARLKKVRGAQEHGESPLKQPVTGLGQAVHLAIEMAAGLAAGGGIGWFLDRWLGTAPWLLVLGLFLGIGAGLRNVFRAAKQMQAAIEREEERKAAGDNKNDGGGGAPDGNP